MSRRYMTKAEHNAILAGLRALQDRLDGPPYSRLEFEAILTDGGVELITVDEIDQLCEDINSDEVQLHVEDWLDEEDALVSDHWEAARAFYALDESFQYAEQQRVDYVKQYLEDTAP